MAKQMSAPAVAAANLYVSTNFQSAYKYSIVSLQEQIIANIRYQICRKDAGIYAQLASILMDWRNTKRLAHIQLAIRRLIASKLPNHNDACFAVDDLDKKNINELAKYKGKLTYDYVTKNCNVDALVALAASLSDGRVAAAVVLTRVINPTWISFADDWGFDLPSFADELIDIVKAYADMNSSSINALCANYSKGPFPTGYAAPDATQTQADTDTDTSTQPQPTKGESTMNTNTNTNTNTNVASSLSSLNAAYKPIIDGMFSQSGLSITVDSVIAEINSKAVVASNLSLAEKEANDLRERLVKESNEAASLRRRLKAASAVSATPSVIDIKARSTTIPDGKMQMVEAGSVFALMQGLTWKVPSFQWDHAHPDVPAINPDYIFRKESLIRAMRCLTNGENIWLAGHTGSGKTTLIEQLAARLGWPVARVAFDSNVDRSELVGRMSLSGDGKGGTVSSWLPGILEKAISHGYILLCDEMDAGHPNALYTLQPLLEGKPLALLEDGGRIVPMSPMFRVVATGNTSGNGDPSGLYPACRILSAATLDRFSTFVNVPYMTVEEEEKLITDNVPSLNKALVTKLAKFAHEMRTAFIAGELPISYSPRRSVSFAKEIADLQAMGFKDEPSILSAAFRSKLYDAASEEFRQRITEIASAALGAIDPTIELTV